MLPCQVTVKLPEPNDLPSLCRSVLISVTFSEPITLGSVSQETFDRDGAWAEEHGRAQFADGHFAGAVSGFRIHDAVGHVYLRPYEGTAAGPDQRDRKNDVLDDVCRFMRVSFGHKCPHARVIMP